MGVHKHTSRENPAGDHPRSRRGLYREYGPELEIVACPVVTVSSVHYGDAFATVAAKPHRFRESVSNVIAGCRGSAGRFPNGMQTPSLPKWARSDYLNSQFIFQDALALSGEPIRTTVHRKAESRPDDTFTMERRLKTTPRRFNKDNTRRGWHQLLSPQLNETSSGVVYALHVRLTS